MKKVYLVLFFVTALANISSAQRTMKLEEGSKTSEANKKQHSVSYVNEGKVTTTKANANNYSSEFVKPNYKSSNSIEEFRNNLYELRELTYYISSEDSHPKLTKEETVNLHEKKTSDLMTSIDDTSFRKLNNEDMTSVLAILKQQDLAEYKKYFTIYKDQY